MNCEHAQRYADAFHDSELDTQLTLEIEDHLVECSTCRQKYEREGALDRQIAKSLREGERTEAMWTEQERIVAATLAGRADALPTGEGRPAAESRGTVWWRELLWPNPKLYAGVVVCWVFMLLAQAQLRQSTPGYDRHPGRPSPLVMMAMMEQRQQLAQLLGPDENEN
jgi:hypothetical protein